MHVSYNDSISPFLDAMEKMNETTPLDGLKWSIEHADQLVRRTSPGSKRWVAELPWTLNGIARRRFHQDLQPGRGLGKLRACVHSSMVGFAWP
jgi:hypothetical protein